MHVGLVLPGFVATEGFPAEELRAKALTRWIVSTPERVAEAIVDAGPRRRAERYVPRPYVMAAVMRTLLPVALPAGHVGQRRGGDDDEDRRRRRRPRGRRRLAPLPGA